MKRTSAKTPPDAPTASEAAFEAVLAGFDTPAGPGAPPDRAPARSAEDDRFIDALFAKREALLGDDRYRNIAQSPGFNTKIAGVSFEGRQDIAAGLREGYALELRRQPANGHDANAIAVLYGQLQLGFLNRELAARLAPLIDAGTSYRATITHVTGGGGKNTGVNIWVERVEAARARAVLAAGAAVDEAAILRALINEGELRSTQREVLAHLERGRNTLAVMGTGRGKSLCFQLPAARDALCRNEKTLVIYPLRALANDQYAALERKLAPLGVAIFRANGSISDDERAALNAALDDGSWHMMLATPEFVRYHSAAFARPHNHPRLVVVDECHHVFESRQRAAYEHLPATLAELGNPQVLGLTATANEATFAHLRKALALEAWVVDPHVRDNLHVVDARGTKDKLGYIEQALAEPGKAIVYCNSRSETGNLAERLRKRLGNEVGFYHGRMGTPDRFAVEEMFRAGRLRVVVATSAFGEGIDLPDVRHVFHYHLNFDLTEFNQQAGRAGRDGQPARIHLLYGPGDKRINEFIIARTAPSLGTLRALYRGLRDLARDGTLTSDNESIARTLELDMVAAPTVGVALRIFAECGLLRLERADDGFFVQFIEVNEKVDLEKNERFVEGEAERRAFERYCEVALGLEAPTLQALINRPIYPRDVRSTSL